jgi:UDP-N-acetylglucosamine 2-epimerase (non-hydrolysing)
MRDTIAILIGTRPGIIKMAPLVHEGRERGANVIVIHSGQHYSDNMDEQIMSDVEIDSPDHHIIRPDDCITHGQQTAYMLKNIEDALIESEPDVLLVCGDANTNLAGALAARKLHITVGHVEAGLRSFDWRMPEEHNRVMIDHISEYLFAPTSKSKSYLDDDNVQGDIFVVGNTVVDSTIKYSKIYDNNDEVKKYKNKWENGYGVLTMHREENVDNPDILERVLLEVNNMAESLGVSFVFAAHPRTQKRISEFGLTDCVSKCENIKTVDPFRYRDFIGILKNAQLVVTDSGGIQEESCILKVPCITVRESTERPETVEVGANRVAGTSPASIREAFTSLDLDEEANWVNPYGDGQASRRIIETCVNGTPRDEFSTPDIVR